MILEGIFIWFTMNLWHEFFHGLEAWRQGARDIFINLDISRLSMTVQYDSNEVNDEGLIRLVGGAGASILSSVMSFLSSGNMRFGFFALAWIQLCYGIFEWKYLDHRFFRIGRYSLYALLITIMVVLYLI